MGREQNLFTSGGVGGVDGWPPPPIFLPQLSWVVGIGRGVL